MIRLLLIALLLAGCPEPSEEPTPPPEAEPTPRSTDPATLEANDAGDHAWARQTTLALWGRMPRSTQEVNVLAALVAESDRETVARAMTTSRVYRDRWQEGIFDLLGVARIGTWSNPGCHDLTLLETDDPALAQFVAGNAPFDGPYGEDFTQLDLVRSALAADDLRPAFRANLYALLFTILPPQSLSEAEGLRQAAAEVFQSVYLGRDVNCLGCHNSEFAVTDHVDPLEDRHWPLPGFVERAVFGSPEGESIEEFSLFFRRRGVRHRYWFDKERPPPEPGAVSLVNGCVSANGGIGCAGCPCEEQVCGDMPECCIVEWTQECAFACSDAQGCQRGDDPSSGDGCFRIQGLEEGGCAGCSCQDFVCDIREECCDGPWTDVCADLCALAPGSTCEPHEDASSAVTPWGMHPNCGEYLDPLEITDDLSGRSSFFIDPFGPEASIHDLERLLDVGMQQLGAEALDPAGDGTVDGPEAFAWMVAARLADRLWQEIVGTSLTLPNGFARNSGQLEILEDLTTTFVEGGWSLADLLVAIVTHPTYNQRAPEDLVGVEPYYFAPVFDPWTISMDDEAVRNNSRGDVVRRRDGRLLQRATSEALGWLKPGQFFSTMAVFEQVDDLAYEIGAFRQQSEPGHDSLGFQDLLAWEDGLSACVDPFDRPTNPECEERDGEGCPECSCTAYACSIRPECCVSEWGPECVALCNFESVGCTLPERPDGYPLRDDWIDALAEAAAGSTWADAVAALKERLLGDPRLEAEERELMEQLLGDSLDSALPGDPEPGLRTLCGVLLSTPQYLIAGDPGPPEALDAAPVYPPGDSFRERCEDFAETLFAPGALTCGDGELQLE